jgi:putative membrane-bound dehydrogenase-like protein
MGHTAPTAPEPPKVPTGFHQIKLNGHTFTLPDGFTIELAAGPDQQADRPIVAAFDEQGHLYVCDSSGSNEKVTEQVQKKPHRIIRLTDSDGDGKYDQSTVFVANVMFPEGAMWLNGSLYVAAPPRILKFTDTDGDGKADKEEVWFDGKTLTGCANDLHGPYAGPDGWIYWCKGAFAKQEYTLYKDKKFSTRAAHIFRARPDGSQIEPVMTGGMDNPVDAVFTPTGDIIFSTTFLQHPGNGQRDGLIHAIYGGVYGKRWDPVYEHPWTSPSLMPPLTHLGPAAPCGLHRYDSDQFGKDYENNIFCCQFNMRKVSRHVLVPTGSTYTTKDSDFVVSDNLDFHPTDVLEDADGSLLILDTGGWYKLCCPTSQLVKPDVKGAIYRVKKMGAHNVADPRGLKINWKTLKPAELADLLDDPRPVVRERAITSLGAMGLSASDTLVQVLKDRDSVRAKRNAIWAACRFTSEKVQNLVQLGLRAGPGVREAALHAVALNRQEPAALSNLLKDADPATRRLAAMAMGRSGNSSFIPQLLKAADSWVDQALDHALTYALIEIGDATKLTEELQSIDNPRSRRVGLAALENLGSIDAKLVLAELNAKDTALRETAWWIAGRHPSWGDQLVGYFQDQLGKADKLTAVERGELADNLMKFARNEAVRKALGSILAESRSDNASQIILSAMARSGFQVSPDDWVKGIDQSLRSRNLETIRAAIAMVRTVRVTKRQFTDGFAGGKGYALRDWGPELELQFLALEPAGIALSAEKFKYVTGKFTKDESTPIRSAAADLLARHDLDGDQLAALCGLLKDASPIELGKLLSAFTHSTDEKVGKTFVQSLADERVRAMIRVEMVKPILEKYPPAVQAEAEKLYALLAEARKGERDKLEHLLKEMPTGDIRRGQLVFNGAKGLCASCHKIGYVGGLVGPDLTRIGAIRNERDLLESIIFPSASFVRSYEPVKVTTLSGKSFNGILKKDAPDEIVLAVAADKEERIARADVEQVTPSAVSIMPAGFEQQLSVQEIADLIAFLKACK